MDLWQHALISSAGSGIIYAVTGDLAASAAFSLTGIFVDLDHLADYWRDTGFNLRVRSFFAHFDRKAPPRLWIFCHGWEWPFLGMVLFLSRFHQPWLAAGTAGWFLHLSLDQYFNHFKPLGYSLVYRASRGFRSRDFVRAHQDSL
jgi:hypothetical protein